MVLTKIEQLPVLKDNSYEFLLAVSLDCLVVMTKDREVVEVIREGEDTKGLLLSCETEDDFLEAILVISRIIDRCEDVFSVLGLVY